MNLKIIDENNFIIYIVDKKIIPELEEKNISEYLKNILIKLKINYKLNIYGYYDVIIYLDKYYGMIIKLIHEELEYLNYYDKQIEMKIIISDNQVFYEIEDVWKIDKKVLNSCNIYLFENRVYLELKKDVNFILLGNLIENSKIIYENTDEIKKTGKKIEIR